MFSTGIVIFREALEIALIVGIILAATRGVPGRMPWILSGFAAGVFGASLIAVFAEAISSAAEGMGQELFNAAILLAAAAVIGWTVLWMRKHSRTLSAELTKLGKDVREGTLPHYSLAVIIGLALLREGSEIVLFVYGMILSGQTAASIISGSILGGLLGTGVGALIYFGLLRMSVKYMFKVTGWLLILLVAGLTSQAAGYLSAAGYFAEFSQPLWDSSALLSEEGILGQTLHSLIGYTAQPTGVQAAFYVSALLILFFGTKIIDAGAKPLKTAVAAILILGLALTWEQPAEIVVSDTRLELVTPALEWRSL